MQRRPRIHRLRGVIQNYPWGSRHVLAELLGRPAPSAQPEAELWLGAHPNGPSLVEVDERWSRFDERIREDPAYWLGPETLAAHGPRLPFLMKVLAVEQPLSLQTHPDAQRAAHIFEQDRHLSPSQRRYTDPYAKPELVCALTRFEALCGVRPAGEIRAWLDAAGLADGMRPVPTDSAPADVREFLARWLRQSGPDRTRRIARLVDAATRRAADDPISRRILALAAHWPGDPGLIAPVLLHDITLEPGEALFLPAGILHCYLSGTAIELMAASDNVVRAGLTDKPVHVDEVLEVASVAATESLVCRAVIRECEQVWSPDAACGFQLSRFDLETGRPIEVRTHSLEILLCHAGHVEVTSDDGRIMLEQGDALAVPAALVSHVLSGPGTIFRAALQAPGLPVRAGAGREPMPE
ncbi:mannose-6-phosphate isomerase, class I [Myxococcota bacterium]|nr:mannose-6-phosphate isomerase, class I [Myxococcota bacterium]